MPETPKESLQSNSGADVPNSEKRPDSILADSVTLEQFLRADEIIEQQARMTRDVMRFVL